MSQLLINLGYGKNGLIELDVFTRMLNDQIHDNEEVRLDKPMDYASGYEYMGVALKDSPIDLDVWSCIRRTWNQGHCIRMQCRTDIAWEDRIFGWS